MVFSGLEHVGKTPFDYVLINGLVRDAQGRKMSKSLNNGVDPLEIIDQYGADALRFMLMTGNTPGNDQRFQIERVEAARNFANKVWNASRFVLMGVAKTDETLPPAEQLELSDRWIIARVNQLIGEVDSLFDSFDLAMAGDKIYEFVWNEYCDWYIEMAKTRLYGEDAQAKDTVERVLIYIMDAIKSIRNSRAEMNIPPSKKAKLYVKTTADEAIFSSQSQYFKGLASVSEIVVVKTDDALPADRIATVSKMAELFLPADELIDYQKELQRLEKESGKVKAEIDRIDKKLSNQGFVAKAPEKIVNAEREKLAEFTKMYEVLGEELAKVKEKLQ